MPCKTHISTEVRNGLAPGDVIGPERAPLNESIASEVNFHQKGKSPMKKSRHSSEQIIRILREADALSGRPRQFSCPLISYLTAGAWGEPVANPQCSRQIAKYHRYRSEEDYACRPQWSITPQRHRVGGGSSWLLSYPDPAH